MAEVFIAVAPGEDAQAQGLAEALRALGYDTASGAPAETEIAATMEATKCVLTLWSGSEPPPSLAVLAALALERKKLVSAEIAADATPAPFRDAPRIDLAPRDRKLFRTRFTDLVAELDKFTSTKGNAEALPAALTIARAALLARAKAHQRGWRTVGLVLVGIAMVFGVGFGAGRVINAVRAGEPLLPPLPHLALPSAAPAEATTTAAPAQPLAVDGIERLPWRAIAAQLTDTSLIKQVADSGDARAQALACLGHLAGVAEFLPSPTAAREYCDASAAQRDPAGLYFSWILRRAAPHAGLDEATARTRLAEAAALGWTSAQIDYAQVLEQDGRAPASQQAEAGRLWLAAAEAGDPRGQFFYARWLRDSIAGPRDPLAAVPFLERAAAQNQPDALHMLATLYRDGIGVVRNPAEARTLYERAAAQNHPASMFNLADMLRDGPEADRVRAVAFYKRLACMPDERQIQPLASRRLRAMGESASCGG